METALLCPEEQMNALPVKSPSAQELVDNLIAEIGLHRVALATFTRIFRRTRPPDTTPSANTQMPDVYGLSAHMRADIGLPPKVEPPVRLDSIMMARHRF